MVRVVKQREARRSELLDCAQKLFLTRGYERTTINDVMEEAGVSKGGFYHHFQAKEDLLEALVARLSQQSVERFTDVLEKPGLDGLSRLNAFFERGRKIKLDDAKQLSATFDPLLNPEHTLLYHRIYAAMAEVIAPLLAKIIDQGVTEGIFSVTNSMATAEVILQVSSTNHAAVTRLANATGKSEARDARAALEERLRFQGIACDRILGLPDGRIDLVGVRSTASTSKRRTS